MELSGDPDTAGRLGPLVDGEPVEAQAASAGKLNNIRNLAFMAAMLPSSHAPDG